MCPIVTNLATRSPLMSTPAIPAEERLEQLLRVEEFAPPAEFAAQAEVADAAVYEQAAADPQAWWAGQARAGLGYPVHRGARRQQPAVLPVVRRRHAQRVVQLPRPARSGRPWRPGRLPLAR